MNLQETNICNKTIPERRTEVPSVYDIVRALLILSYSMRALKGNYFFLISTHLFYSKFFHIFMHSILINMLCLTLNISQFPERVKTRQEYSNSHGQSILTISSCQRT